MNKENKYWIIVDKEGIPAYRSKPGAIAIYYDITVAKLEFKYIDEMHKSRGFKLKQAFVKIKD